MLQPCGEKKLRGPSATRLLATVAQTAIQTHTLCQRNSSTAILMPCYTPGTWYLASLLLQYVYTNIDSNRWVRT